jgi:hypothetical protein
MVNLELEVVFDNNPKSFAIHDISEYHDKIAIEFGVLEITPPGFETAEIFNVKPFFKTKFNASVLNINKAKTYKSLADLPDGIYSIKYSIKPNKKTMIEYDYFRNTLQIQRYASIACALMTEKCQLSLEDYTKRKRELVETKFLIDSAKFLAEECGKPREAIRIYKEADEKLKKLSDCKC